MSDIAISEALTLGALPGAGRYTGHWWPIYLEPVPGSGERMTVAIIVVGDSGERVVHNPLPADTLRNGVAQLVNDAILELRRQLLECSDVDALVMPSAAIIRGTRRDGQAANLQGLAIQASQYCASLGIRLVAR
jgi:hypothetical protein